MGQDRIEQLWETLLGWAPEFFSENARGATAAEIDGLEEFAERAFYPSYRSFLRHFGNTPAGAMNPFLNDRDVGVETLRGAYQLAKEDAAEGVYVMPDDVIFFSSSELLREVINLRQRSDGEIEIGYLDWETGHLDPATTPMFGDWLFSSAFFFRKGQFHHERAFESPFNKAPPEGTSFDALMEQAGLDLLFDLTGGQRCYEGGGLAVTHFADGDGFAHSGRVAGDDLARVEQLCSRLAATLGVKVSGCPGRLRSPRR